MITFNVDSLELTPKFISFKIQENAIQVIIHALPSKDKLTDWGLYKIVDILQTTFSNALYGMKIHIVIEIQYFPMGLVKNNTTLVQLMARHQTRVRPISWNN